MAQRRTASTPKSKDQTSLRTAKLQIPRTGLFAFLAAFAGIVAAVPLTIALMMPVMHQELAKDVASLGNTRTVQLQTAADPVSCSQPNAVTTGTVPPLSSAGHVLGANTTATPPSPPSSSSTVTPPPFVQHLISGSFTSNGTISNTGPGSTNSVASTETMNTTVTNNNNFNVSNSNTQNASSGDATASRNTTTGTTQTGDASNTNSTDMKFVVNN